MQQFSQATLEAISRISPDILEEHGIIQPARVSGYTCPICGSGEGSHGTGMEYNAKVESHTSFTCFSGGHSFNVLKLCALHYGLDTRNDFRTLIEKICADFNIALEYEEFTMTSGKRSAKKSADAQKHLTLTSLKTFKQI